MRELKLLPLDNTALEDGVLVLPQQGGGGLDLAEAVGATERYIAFDVEVLEEHSLVWTLECFDGGDEPGMTIRFGCMPGVRCRMAIDLQWLNGDTLFPEHAPGLLKIVCHGRRVLRDELTGLRLTGYPCFHPARVRIENLQLADEKPDRSLLSGRMLVDRFGQYALKRWSGKIGSEAELRERLCRRMESPDAWPEAHWNEYGGDSRRKLAEKSGFFSKVKSGGRWYLVDPTGSAFLSLGVTCVTARSDCRVDGVESLLEWLPEQDEFLCRRQDATFYGYIQANLRRVFGESWQAAWQTLIVRGLKAGGFNTLANWSDPALCRSARMPYALQLPEFPSTGLRIFRDFPDVFSQEYEENAEKCAQALKEFRDDPFLIGYFMRNEPGWAFVDNLVIADEVLYSAEDSVCKRRLIAWLQEKYGQIQALNQAWGTGLESFEQLRSPLRSASARSAASAEDMRAFSRKMLEAYVGIPARACRAIDPNHMNLGMRYAWISNRDLTAGWENFDVFSVNCYSVDPTSRIEQVASLGVDLPVVIGEFHFGALDAGLTATGLEGVPSQEERGIALQYYMERAVKHPLGVGCHYFQCYDQFALGRFDGENYNIGLFDICSQPYEPMMEGARRAASRMYAIASGECEPTNRRPGSIPMIAY